MSTSFEQVHAQQIVGTLTTVDRLIVHGHLQSFWFRGLGLARFIDRQGLHIARDFGGYVRQASDRVIAHAKSLAAEAHRPYIFQRRVERGKDDLARQIARRDGITQGLICVLATVVAARSHRPSATLDALRRYDPRREPDAVVPHVRICGGGRGRPRFLLQQASPTEPRMHRRPKLFMFSRAAAHTTSGACGPHCSLW